jgi:hypothetical protein
MQLKNQRGSALMVVMGVVAIVVVLFPIVMKYLGTFDTTTAVRRRQEDFERFIQSINYEINDGTTCFQLLHNQPLNPAALGTAQHLTIFTGYGAKKDQLTDGWFDPQSDIHIDTVRVTLTKHALDQSGNPMKVTLDWPPFPGVLDKYEADILITPKDLAWNSDATKYPQRHIKVFLNLLLSSPTAATVQQCYGPGSIAEACEAIGGAFDGRADTPANLRCNPDVRCFNNKSGLTDNPGSCSYPYAPDYVGNFNGVQKYLCTWCNRNK